MPAIGNGIGPPFRKTLGANLNFVSTWDTTQAGSASDTVVLPLLSGGTYDGTIDWGDGNTSALSYANRTHQYSSSGTYTIRIWGQIEGFQFNSGDDRAKITDISNWATLNITTPFAFIGCSNLDISATDAPSISSTSLRQMFNGCTSLTTADFSSWDVSSVTEMRGIFNGCTSFNGDITTWDVSSVTTFFEGFRGCSVFNQDIGGWDVSSVTGSGFGSMFRDCTAFNQNLGSWDVSGATSIDMFFISGFNNGGSTDINNWNVTNVTNLSGAFAASPFNQPIGDWDVSNVTLFSQFGNGMFTGNTAFNQDISGWDMTSATTIRGMFFNATSFNQPIGAWDTSNITDMSETFRNATSFNQDLSNWQVSQVTSFGSFMNSVTLSTANYDALLIAWDAQGAMSYSGTVNFGSSKYTAGGAAETARTSLIAKWGGITDGGVA